MQHSHEVTRDFFYGFGEMSITICKDAQIL